MAVKEKIASGLLNSVKLEKKHYSVLITNKISNIWLSVFLHNNYVNPFKAVEYFKHTTLFFTDLLINQQEKVL